MQTEYTLLRQTRGNCYFARVRVEGESTSSGIMEISEAIQEPHGPRDWQADRERFPDWFDAALRGARWCAEKLLQQGHIAGCRVAVVRVAGVEVDTNVEGVFCAGALATWQLFNPDAALPAFELVDGKWQISFD